MECFHCSKPIVGRGRKFCSRSCAASVNNALAPKRKRAAESRLNRPKSELSANHVIAVEKWLTGETTGLQVNGVVSQAVKRYLRRTRGNACELCGWKEVNPVTGRVPVVADHIDGNWRNNRPENLRLLCPNCDSLQPTYKALNRGNGRPVGTRR